MLLALPTGGGKTVIAAHVITRAWQRGKRVVFFAHRRELVHQAVRKLINADVPADAIGVLMANDPLTNPAAPIQVSSIDTWRHREPPLADLVIVDEAHRSLAQTYLDAIKHYAESGAVVLGMTATPYRADGGGLGDVYEELEVVSTPSELIKLGFLVEPRVFSAPPPDLRGVRSRYGEYVESDLADAMNQRALVGNIVEHWKKHASGIRTVAFSVNVEHSQSITARFLDAGVPAEHLDGTTPTKERDAILRRLESGETLVVSNCGVLCEGWDQPAVKCAILARPTKSTGLYLQQAGRILRPFGEQRAIILDHAGNALEHGLPQDDREFDLDVTKKKIGGAGPAKICPECSAVVALSASKCSECGFEFEVSQRETADEADGELVEITPVDPAVMRAAWAALIEDWTERNERRVARGQPPIKPGFIWHRFCEHFNGRKPPPDCKLPPEVATPEEKIEAFRQLRQQCRERGYKPGWVTHRFRERFGHFPGASP